MWSVDVDYLDLSPGSTRFLSACVILGKSLKIPVPVSSGKWIIVVHT